MVMDMRLERFLMVLVLVIMVVVVGLAYLVQNNNRNIDRLDRNLAAMQVQVDHLENFVNDLEAESPDEEIQNQAVQEAVRQVPQIRAILCEAFPDVPSCMVRPG